MPSSAASELPPPPLDGELTVCMGFASCNRNRQSVATAQFCGVVFLQITLQKPKASTTCRGYPTCNRGPRYAVSRPRLFPQRKNRRGKSQRYRRQTTICGRGARRPDLWKFTHGLRRSPCGFHRRDRLSPRTGCQKSSSAFLPGRRPASGAARDDSDPQCEQS